MMAKRTTKLITDVYTCFLPFQKSQETLLNDTFGSNSLEGIARINKTLRESISDDEKAMFLSKGKKSFACISVTNYGKQRRSEDDDDLIYEVVIDAKTKNCSLSTGKYCGVISFAGGLKLTIQTSYSNYFLKRILNYCSGIYFDTATSNSYIETNNNIYNLLVQYLFLMSLRKVVNKGFPRKYALRHHREYSINGEIDINRYINCDFLSQDKKVSYNTNEQEEIQCIVDTLYFALTKCCFVEQNNFLPNLKKYKNYLKGLYSNKKPSTKCVRDAVNNKRLNNSLYASYKVPLKYAKVLIDSSDVSHDESGKKGASGYLIDVTLLWEMYLATLISINFPNWIVESQAEIHFYDDKEFRKTNYPDLVMTNKNTDEVFILDAKFKQMDFRGTDFDNGDIQQIHSYSYYYHLKYGDKFLGAALVYPSKEDIREKLGSGYYDGMFGSKDAKVKFGILTIKDPGDCGSMIEQEAIFVSMLQKMIGR